MTGRHLASRREPREVKVESPWHFKTCRWPTTLAFMFQLRATRDGVLYPESPGPLATETIPLCAALQMSQEGSVPFNPPFDLGKGGSGLVPLPGVEIGVTCSGHGRTSCAAQLDSKAHALDLCSVPSPNWHVLAAPGSQTRHLPALPQPARLPKALSCPWTTQEALPSFRPGGGSAAGSATP